jgi:hypothetical protein
MDEIAEMERRKGEGGEEGGDVAKQKVERVWFHVHAYSH